MNKQAPRASFLQVTMLTLLSLAAVGPLLWKRGLDVVTRTYLEASARLWSGASPYVPPGEGLDWFKYSPAFAFLYRPLAFLSPPAHALVWAALNAGVFWWGVSLWFRLEKRSPKLLWIAFALVAMELDISLRYQQVNGLIAGLVLAGLRFAASESGGVGGALLAVAAELKVLPGVFLGALFFPWRPRYVVGALAGLLVLLALPALAVGGASCVRLHGEWLALLARNLGEPGLLDLKSVFARMDALFAGEFLRSLVLLASIVVFGGYRLFEGRRSNFDHGAWLIFGVSALLLLSPRTESPTFVWIAPAYLFLAERILPLEGRKRALATGAWAALAFFVTLAYTDLWPKRLWNPVASFYASKTLAVFVLWCFSAALLVRFTLNSSFRRKPDSP